MKEKIKADEGGLLNKYTTQLREKIGSQDGEFWYRGQRDAQWPLISGVTQRITDKPSEARELISHHRELIGYHEDLLESARSIGGNWDSNGRKLGDLELLAKLQHYGAATCLLDLTSSFNIAIWFACQKADGYSQNSEEDGKVFVVPINPANTKIDFLKVRSDELEEPIKYFLNPETRRIGEKEKKQISHGISDRKPRFWCWDPGPLMGRMLSQASRFIFSSYNISQEKNLYREIRIEAKDKEGLLLELEQQQGLKPQNIFSDIPGLASINVRGIPHRLKRYKDHLRVGRSKAQEGDYEGSIKNLNRANKLRSNEPTILFERGKAQMGWVESKASLLGRERSWELLRQARDDLETARDLAKGIENKELQNQIKEKLKELISYEENLDDYMDYLEEEYRSALEEEHRSAMDSY